MSVTNSSRSERGAAALPLTVVLAVVAVLVVLTAAVVAGLGARGGTDTTVSDPDPATPDTSASGGTTGSEEPEEDEPGFFPDGQVLTGDRRDNANVEVPSVEDGWETTTSDFTIGYLDREGLPAVGVTGPAVWEPGRCGDEADDERAWAGFGPPYVDGGEDDVARSSMETIVEAWESTIAESPDTVEVSEVETGTTTISDGTEAATATFTFRVSDEEADCFPPAYELRFLSFDTGDFAANVVLQRGVARDGSDVEGHLDAQTADVIMASARRQQEQ